MVKHERLRYLCEMAAAIGAVGVFVAVYLIAYMQFGAMATLLAAWLPAAVLAWLAARALRAALHRMLDLAPPRAAALARALAATPHERRLARWLTAFEADLDGEDHDWLPAWLLVEQPLLAGPLAAAQAQRDSPPERAFRTVLALLRLEREGRQREIAEQRRLLRDLHPGLFALYLKTR